jgi:ABC-type maltose transport system permease subunit
MKLRVSLESFFVGTLTVSILVALTTLAGTALSVADLDAGTGTVVFAIILSFGAVLPVLLAYYFLGKPTEHP